jgi:hypothetical protein
MDERVLGALGIKLQIYCIGRQENKEIFFPRAKIIIVIILTLE